MTLDLFSRKIVGLAIDFRMTAELVLGALRQALTRRPPTGVVHHSDRGSQYTSRALKLLADNYGIQLSMGKGDLCRGSVKNNSRCEKKLVVASLMKSY